MSHLSDEYLDFLADLDKIQSFLLKNYAETVAKYGFNPIPERISKQLTADMDLYSDLTKIKEHITGEKVKVKKEGNAKLFLFEQSN